MKYSFTDVIDIQADNRSIHQGMGQNMTMVNITVMGEESYLMNATLPLIVDELIVSSKEISADLCVDWNKKYDNHKDILSSLQKSVGSSSGDLFRYLILWGYCGIYADIDNAPEYLLKNVTIITDDMDVEAARFLSQYFILGSPHHPAMYMAVQVTIQCLLNAGGFKWGVHSAIGQAYVNYSKTWDTFLHSRSMRYNGNRTTAMKQNYIL